MSCPLFLPLSSEVIRGIPCLCFSFPRGLNDKSDSTSNADERRLVEQLWQELKPLHRLVHAYLRQQMSKLYPGVIQLDQPIPVHLTSKRILLLRQTEVHSDLFSRGSLRFNDDTSGERRFTVSSRQRHRSRSSDETKGNLRLIRH